MKRSPALALGSALMLTALGCFVPSFGQNNAPGFNSNQHVQARTTRRRCRCRKRSHSLSMRRTIVRQRAVVIKEQPVIIRESPLQRSVVTTTTYPTVLPDQTMFVQENPVVLEDRAVCSPVMIRQQPVLLGDPIIVKPRHHFHLGLPLFHLDSW